MSLIFVPDSFSMSGILGADFDGSGIKVVIDGFRFDGDLRSLIERCREGLQLLEESVREVRASVCPK